MVPTSNHLWNVSDFVVEFMSGPVFFFHIEMAIFITGLAIFSASQNTVITVMAKKKIFSLFHVKVVKLFSFILLIN